MKRTFIILVLASSTVFGQQRGAAPGANLPAGPGREMLTTACTTCHNLNTVVNYRAGKAGWQEVVDNMVLQGAQVLPEEGPTLIDYLATHLGPNSPPLTSNRVTLPAGPGKELVETKCATCHALERTISIKRTPEEWNHVLDEMTKVGLLTKVGLQITADERRSVVTYLNAQFGKPAPQR
jgi:cytochrome c5